MKKILLALTVATLPIAALSAPRFATDAPIAFMTDMSSGAVLYEKNADRPIPPASMAKMMTVYVAFDQVKRGKLSLDEPIELRRTTWEKWRGQGSTMFLMPDDRPTVKDLLHGVITLSGNDASVVLAEKIAGTEDNFADLMTKTARRIGMSNSRFGNATGWPDEGRTMVTARDLATLGARLSDDFPELYNQFFGLSQFTWGRTNSGDPITQPNRNPLLGKVKGADGLKTGHTEEAGFGFTGSARQDGRRIVSVLAGLDSYGARSAESVRFMYWGFDAWKAKPLYSRGAVIGSAEVQNGASGEVRLVAPRDLSVSYPKGGDPAPKLAIRYKGPVQAPIAKGQRIAELVVRTPDTDAPQVTPLIAADAVGEAGFFRRAWLGFADLVGIG